MSSSTTDTVPNWTPTSWKSPQFTVAQQVDYPIPSTTTASDSDPDPDPVAFKRKKSLASVVNQLSSLPPIVSPVEIERLKVRLAAVSKGDAFLLQGGDCAELFSYCNSEQIEHRLSLLLSMSLILIWGMKLPVVRIARMAGQYAKPRSKSTEIVDGKEIPSFRGDNVNGHDVEDRIPDPERLLSAYFHSSTTSNYVRLLLSSGFASLPNSSSEKVPWSLPLEHVRSPELLKSYEEIVKNLSEALEFLAVIGVDRGNGGSSDGGGLDSAEVYLSHEALMLDYESALTRRLTVPGFARKAGGDDKDGWYCTSAHFIWIGDRTRSLTGAHVEFFRGIRNPIGIKVGPSMKPEELVALLDIVDPDNIPGRVTLISRYGAETVEKLLPGHIKAVQATLHPVVWCCDPMHGNTSTSPSGIKTRSMSNIVSEISSNIKIHSLLGSRLGGVHLELTGDIIDGKSVTECTGGSMELGEEMLGLRFESYCDPRLNFEQSLDVAFLLSDQFQAARRGRPSALNNIFDQLSNSRAGSVDSTISGKP